MKFEELGTESIDLSHSCLIYFLIKDDEVVYVGKTQRGLLRPLSHTDKDFNRLEVLECIEEVIDMLENEFIVKYLPKYNKSLNTSYAYSLSRCRNEVRKNTNLKSYTLHHLRKDLKRLEIEIKINEFNVNGYITIHDLDMLVEDLQYSEEVEQ